MSAAFPGVTPQYTSVSPLLADAVNQTLVHFSKIYKTLIELTNKISLIQNDTAAAMITTAENFTKKLAEITKGKLSSQNESLVKFMTRLLEQIDIQAKILQSMGNSFNDCVVTPLQDTMDSKKEIWRNCFHYVDSFQRQVSKKEDDLIKRYRDYTECFSKVKSTDSKKHLQICHNSHNTYLLRLSSVNSINRLLYTHVLPHVLHSIETHQGELNDSLRHHIKYMFSTQKDSFKKIIKSIEKIDHATAKIDIVSDIKKFCKSFKAKDKTPPYHSFVPPKQEAGKRGSILLPDNLNNEAFILNKYTQPNLQRRLASLQFQTSELVDSISSMRTEKDEVVLTETIDPSRKEIAELLFICDKEANLNVLLKQMELYTPDVLDFLGRMPENLIYEQKHTDTSPTHITKPTLAASTVAQKPHEFVERVLVRPISCSYCKRLLTIKGFVCKTCKMSVHKKCALNAPFCGGVVLKLSSKVETTKTYSNTIPESSVVYDLIDFDDYEDFTDDEFDDGEDDLLSFSQPAVSTIITKTKPLTLSTEPSVSLTTRSSITKPNVMLSLIDQSRKPSVPKKPISLLKSSDGNEFCVSLYNFHGTQDTELSFSAGSKIEIISKDNNDWWQGKCNQFSGYFPAQYVMSISKNDTIFKVLYSFQPEADMELAVDEGQIVLLVYKDDDWLKVRSFDGEGLVPSSYLECIS